MSRIDVLVVGLGPAGASAAAQAARHGCRVVALDRRREAGVPVQCAEFVPAMVATPAGAVQAVDSMHTYVEEEAPDLKGNFPGHMLDRAAFDAALVDAAAHAGAQCRFGAPVRRITAEGGVHLASGEVLCARVLIGADGPRSLVGRAIGSINRELVETRQITVPLLARHAATDIFLSAAIPGGYGWLFPKNDLANLGAGVDPAYQDELKAIVARLHARLQREHRVGADILATTGGAIPVGGLQWPSGTLGESTVFLAGDAAGLANPVTGAGIAAAVHSGNLAGECAAAMAAGDERGATRYAEELEDLYGAALERAVRRRRELMQSNREKAALRRGWIAYAEYWQ